MTDTRITAQAFCNRHGITSEAEYTDSNPHMDPSAWSEGASHWKVVLKRGRRRLTVYFSMGAAHHGEPKTCDVLSCLAMDAAGVENARCFEDWCGEYGYDTDSRRAHRTYRLVQRQAAKLRRFLGEELYQVALWDMDE